MVVLHLLLGKGQNLKIVNKWQDLKYSLLKASKRKLNAGNKRKNVYILLLSFLKFWKHLLLTHLPSHCIGLETQNTRPKNYRTVKS